jgi:alkylation response protein AidB-like acyl-CoA dehydrogenase
VLVGSVHPALGVFQSAHQSIGVPQPTTMFGTEEQKRTWLPRCTKKIGAFLLTEPDVGSDPARMRATAARDGDDYVIDGVKLRTTNGVVADLLVVMAQVPKGDGHRGGTTAFVVPADAPGIMVQNCNTFTGLRDIESDDRTSTLKVGRLSLPAVCTGTITWCLRIARDWSRERVQWASPSADRRARAPGVRVRASDRPWAGVLDQRVPRRAA